VGIGADAGDDGDIHHADHDAVRQQPGEVGPGRQRGAAHPLEHAFLTAHGQHDGELAVAGAEHRQRGDRRHVVLQRRQPVEVGAAPAAEQRAEQRDDHHWEREGEERALRVTPERQLLVADLVPQQGQVITP
jgi:hypothetical protein